jgi:hypothetical protein
MAANSNNLAQLQAAAPAHRANLLLHGANWIGVANAQPNVLGNGHQRRDKRCGLEHIRR